MELTIKEFIAWLIISASAGAIFGMILATLFFVYGKSGEKER